VKRKDVTHSHHRTVVGVPDLNSRVWSPIYLSFAYNYRNVSVFTYVSNANYILWISVMREFTRSMRRTNERMEKEASRIYAFTHLRSNLKSSKLDEKS
jgi:hypothetical protein